MPSENPSCLARLQLRYRDHVTSSLLGWQDDVPPDAIACPQVVASGTDSLSVARNNATGSHYFVRVPAIACCIPRRWRPRVHFYRTDICLSMSGTRNREECYDIEHPKHRT